MQIPEHIVAQWHKAAMSGTDEQGFGPNSCWGKFALLARKWNMEPEQMSNNVNHPVHYNQTGIECIDAIKAALGSDGFHAYCKGQVIKYLWRAEHKGNRIEDLRKAQWYMEKLIVEQNEEHRPTPPSLKEQALLAIDTAVADNRISAEIARVTRAALERLQELENNG